jgi:hypothetical protein
MEFGAKRALFVDAPLARTPIEAELGRLNDGGRRRRGVRETEARAVGVLRERDPCRPAGPATPEAHQQLHRAGDRHGDRRGLRRRGEVGALAQGSCTR